MNDKLLLLLETLCSREGASPHHFSISPEEVNCVARELGLGTRELFAFMDELNEEKFVRVKSGGTVMTTAAGRQALNTAHHSAANFRPTGNTLTAVLFADVAGYSKLEEPQLQVFMSKVLPELSEVVVDPFRDKLQELNSWGDAIVASSRDPYDLMKLALNLRDFFRNRHWHADLLPNLNIRVALHAGVVFFGYDPIRRTSGMIGTQVNLTARIEPVVAAGDVWVTEAFFHMIDPKVKFPATFDNLGSRPLAKAFGEEILHRLRRTTDQPLGA